MPIRSTCCAIWLTTHRCERGGNGPSACSAEESGFFERYGPEARQVLAALIEKYAEHGAAQFKLPEILEVAPFNEWGNVIEIAARFGGGDRLRRAVDELHRRLYVA